MSQAKQFADIKSWTQAELAERWQDALGYLVPKLSHPDETVCDILTTIYDLLLQKVPVDSLEISVLPQVCETTGLAYSSLLKSVVSERECSHDVKHPPNSVNHSIQCCLDMVSSIDSFVNYLSMAANSGRLRLCQLRSLPDCVVTLINKSYNHCKESRDIYGDWFQDVCERLSALFKCVHRLQTSFSSLLDKLDLSCLSAQETRDLCNIIESLSAVCNVASHLDAKVMVTLWKTISRLSCLHKESLIQYLDIDTILTHLCYNMISTCHTLNQFELSLNQNSADLQNKSIKILGFQMKVLIALVSDYVDSLSDCVGSIFKLSMLINGILYQTSTGQCLLGDSRAEFNRHVCVGLEPLVKNLLSNREFIRIVTSASTDDDNDSDLGRFITYTSVMRMLQDKDEILVTCYLAPDSGSENEPTRNILDTIFSCFSKCYVDLCIPTLLPGIMTSGKPLREINLYEFACIHICVFVTSTPAKHFAVVENCLLSNVLGGSSHCALLATDIWCFVARYGSADLCRDHCQFLTSIHLQLTASTGSSHLVLLLRRLIKLMSAGHQEDYLAKLSIEESIKLFADVPLSVIQSSAVRQKLSSQLIAYCCLNIENFLNNSQLTINHSQQSTLDAVLACIAELMSDQGLLSLPVEIQHQLVGGIRSLLCVFTNGESHHHHHHYIVNGRLLRVLAQLSWETNMDFLTKGLSYCCDLLNQPYVEDVIKLNTLDLLSSIATRVFPPSAEQTHILRLIAQLFSRLLGDSGSLLVQQQSLQVFAKFAEKTAHESIVSESLSYDDNTRSTAVHYFNQLSAATGELVCDAAFLKAQHRILLSQHSFHTDHTSDPLVDVKEQPSKKRAKVDEENSLEGKSELDVAIAQIHSALQTLKDVKAAVGSLPPSAVELLSDASEQIKLLC